MPTVGEFVTGYEATSWYGIVGPAGIPKTIVTRLHGAIVEAIGEPDVKQRLVAQAIDPVGNAPEAFGAYLKAETVKWAKVLKIAGVKPE